MKILVKCLISVTLAVVMLLSAISCGHECEFGIWETVIEATCTEDGKAERYCSCGEKETKIIEAIGHTEVVDKSVDSTCTETGLTEGKHCSECGEILKKQTKTSKKEHSGDEGVCTICGTVTNAKLALACYIIDNGTEFSENSYCIYEKSTSSDGNKITTYIMFDYENLEFSFHMIFEYYNSNASTYVSMNVDLDSNVQKTEMKTTLDGINWNYGYGNIYADTFDFDNLYIYNFVCDNSSYYSSLKNLLEVGTASMLKTCGTMIENTNTGVNISMFGFKNP